ncbi:unnamed protein product [Protopolystoma xenopodis]|uniref:Uncharacterized protein n=1 Tax=Protopolystoma xenopodis TaxID=117903 RepID=A0A3S4ZW25_9PLAT|nr:unnamed protein product [Protopolystoma xenopodis]
MVLRMSREESLKERAEARHTHLQVHSQTPLCFRPTQPDSSTGENSKSDTKAKRLTFTVLAKQVMLAAGADLHCVHIRFCMHWIGADKRLWKNRFSFQGGGGRKERVSFCVLVRVCVRERYIERGRDDKMSKSRTCWGPLRCKILFSRPFILSLEAMSAKDGLSQEKACQATVRCWASPPKPLDGDLPQGVPLL